MTDDIEVWYFMIPVAMVFVGFALALFFWSVKSDQFEDLDRHASNILFDDDEGAHQQAQTPQAQIKQTNPLPASAASSEAGVSKLAVEKEQHEHSA